MCITSSILFTIFHFFSQYNLLSSTTLCLFNCSLFVLGNILLYHTTMSSENIVSLSNDAKRQKTSNDLNFSKYVSIKFVNQDNKSTFLRVLRTAKLGKAFATYTEFHNLDYHVDFTYNGDRVHRNLTPYDLDLEDGDVIDVFKHVHGGGSRLPL